MKKYREREREPRMRGNHIRSRMADEDHQRDRQEDLGGNEAMKEEL